MGVIARKDFRSSWAGATGLTQFLPSEYFSHGVDLDGTGRVDIWHSVPDALASAAKQLADKGWQPGLHWAYEVRAPQNADCTMGVPSVQRPLRDWIRAGFQTVGGGIPPREADQSASLLQPEGSYGPSFLVTKNYFVIKEYNFSDLYVLYVGHLPTALQSRSLRDAVGGGIAIAHHRRRDDAARIDAARLLQGEGRRQGRHADACCGRSLSEVGWHEGRLLAERSGVAVAQSPVRRLPMPKNPLFRILAWNWLAGAAVAVILFGGLIGTNTMHLRDLIAESDQPLVPVAMLVAGFLVTFTSVAMGTAIMTMPLDEDPSERHR